MNDTYDIYATSVSPENHRATTSSFAAAHSAAEAVRDGEHTDVVVVRTDADGKHPTKYFKSGTGG